MLGMPDNVVRKVGRRIRRSRQGAGQLTDLSGLAGEYETLLEEAIREGREVESVLVGEAEWTPVAAQHLVQLVRDYGSFMLRNATAIAIALNIEDGELGF